jgi:hypothetical protein
MIPMNATFLRGGYLGMTLLLAGCTSAGSSNPPAQAQPRPIERVREEIVALKEQMGKTVAATEAITATPGTNLSTREQNLSRELRATETLVDSLRANAKQLNERANEYLAVWGGQVNYIGAQGGPQVGTNQPRQQAKATYDRMVAELIKARDVLLPLQTSLQQLEQRLKTRPSPTQVQAMAPDVRQAVTDGQAVISHLQSALTTMDELTAQLRATNPQR